MAITKVTSSVLSSGSATDGYVLTADGSGNSAWEAAAGGGVDGIVSSADATAITIDSSERVGIGTTSPVAPLTINDKATFSFNVNDFALGHHLYYDSVSDRWERLSGSAGSALYQTAGTMVFYRTTAGGSTGDAVTPSESMRITSGGLLAVGGTNTYHNAVNGVYGRLGVTETASSGVSTLVLINTSTSLTGYTSTFTDGSFTSNTANYSFYTCFTGNGSTISDVEFSHRGDGQAYADGAWNGGGADYAEYFEWEDGNSSSEDRRGWSVVLVNEKIRRATSDDDASTIIGVISGNPGVVGDSDIQGKWKGKYLKDDFGTFIRETVQAYHWKTVDDDGQIISHNMHEDRVPEGVTVPTVEENDTFTSTTVDRKVDNPAYVEGQEYIQRENRPEWDTVGLMGKLRILKTEQKGTNWIKMRDISATVEEWLVR